MTHYWECATFFYGYLYSSGALSITVVVCIFS